MLRELSLKNGKRSLPRSTLQCGCEWPWPDNFAGMPASLRDLYCILGWSTSQDKGVQLCPGISVMLVLIIARTSKM
jgi:hypothetical protein